MGLDDFKGQNKDELSMIEVALAILQDSGKRMAFADIVNAVQNYLGKSDEEIREKLPQFYTDMNTDGEFISMGDNVWALRSWFPFDSVDEEVNHPEDEDEEGTNRKKHHKKVNAFIADSDDDDVIDYDDDDPEDDDLDVTDGDEDDDYSDSDDLDDADTDDLDDGIEGQLSELHQDDLNDDDE